MSFDNKGISHGHVSKTQNAVKREKNGTLIRNSSFKIKQLVKFLVYVRQTYGVDFITSLVGFASLELRESRDSVIGLIDSHYDGKDYSAKFLFSEHYTSVNNYTIPQVIPHD